MIIKVGSGAGRHRLIVVIVIVAVHVVLAITLTRSRQLVRIPLDTAITIVVVPEPVAPVVLEKVEHLAAIGVSLPVPEFDIAGATILAPASCDLLTSVAHALQASPALGIALAPGAGGQARAIMAWNGAWPEQPETPAIRDATTKALATAPPICLDETLVGPRIIFLQIDGATVSVAIGSGMWHWRQLIPST